MRLPIIGSRNGRAVSGGLALVEPGSNALAEGRVGIRDLLAPAAVDPQPGCLDLGGRFARTLKVVVFPREVENGWLDALYSFPADLRIAQYLHPLPSGPTVAELGREIQKLDTKINEARRRGKPPSPYDEVAMEDATALRDALARNQIKLFNFHLFVTIFEESVKELDRVTHELEQALQGGMILARSCYFEQEEAFKTTLPLGRQLLKAARNMDSLSLSTTLAFSTSDLCHRSGEFWGINAVTRSVVVLDRGLLPAGHVAVLGATGSGKGYAVKDKLTQARIWGRPVLVVDPSKNEYERWVCRLGGEYVFLGPTSEHKINPLALVPPRDLSRLDADERRPVTERVEFVKNLLELLLCNPGERLNPQERAVLDRHLWAVYRARGIEDDWASVYDASPDAGLSMGRLKSMPVLGDVLDSLRSDRAAGETDLAGRLEPYVRGGLGLFNGQTNVDLGRDLLAFNIYQLLTSYPQLAPAVYYVLSDFAMKWLRADLRAKEVAFDEAHHMFKHLATAQFAERVYREARKTGSRAWLLTQCLTDFLGPEEDRSDTPLKASARACLANAHTKLILMQTNLREAQYCARVFGLSDAEARFIAPPSQVTEESKRARAGLGVLIAAGQRVVVKGMVPLALHRLITTDPEELAVIEDMEREAGRVAG